MNLDKEKLKNFDKLPADVRRQFSLLMNQYAEKKKQSTVKNDFMAFVKHVWPDFVEGKHHKQVAKKFNDIAEGKVKRVIINMAPRHTKSEFASYLLPAWMVGRNPKLKIIQSTNTTELSVRFGRKAKALMDSQEYKEIFQTRLKEDSQAAGKWETQQGGEYYAAGVGSAITGRGADLLIIDDPHTEQDAMNAQALDRTYEWYTSGPRQRLQPGGTIVIVMTRWNEKDLAGRLISAQKEPKADKWEVIEFPAIMPSGKPLWPEYWNLKDLEAVKASIPLSKWNAQYMQNPTAEEGAIIKREWWNVWDNSEPPPCSYIIRSYDTAFSKNDRADYSAITTWGIFTPVEGEGDAIILLDAEKGRWDFPELKQKAYELSEVYDPDMILIEQKASGTPLTQELRRMGVPVTPFTPSKGADKFARMNACAPVFESGMVWRPDANFAEEVVEECASFPHGDHDDLADSMTQAILRFRQGGFISTPDDEEFEPGYRKKMEYY